MQGVLVRIGVDHTYGGWNAPVDPVSGRFVFVPIPERATSFQPGCERRYDEVVDPLAGFLSGCGANGVASRFPLDPMRGRAMHLDPDFEHLTYGDVGAWRGSHIRTLSSGDLLVFYAGLRSVRPADRQLIYAIVGVYVVDHVLSAHDVSADRRHENAHTRRTAPGASDIVVRARPGLSGRCSRCVSIGEFRNRAYRVRRDILDEWGGLSVNDGYIQRSARPPKFSDAARFYRWWQGQGIALVRSNFAA